MEPDRWLGIELRHFLALEAVAREGSFVKAAGALGYTQSAVSQQIAALERIVGQRLVERPGGPRRVSLTEAGELLLRHAAGIGARVLPRLLREFGEAWPAVEIQLTESADDGYLLELVERGELDVSFVVLPA